MIETIKAVVAFKDDSECGMKMKLKCEKKLMSRKKRITELKEERIMFL